MTEIEFMTAVQEIGQKITHSNMKIILISEIRSTSELVRYPAILMR